jgi:hypothetical protein
MCLFMYKGIFIPEAFRANFQILKPTTIQTKTGPFGPHKAPWVKFHIIRNNRGKGETEYCTLKIIR